MITTFLCGVALGIVLGILIAYTLINAPVMDEGERVVQKIIDKAKKL